MLVSSGYIMVAGAFGAWGELPKWCKGTWAWGKVWAAAVKPRMTVNWIIYIIVTALLAVPSLPDLLPQPPVAHIVQ